MATVEFLKNRVAGKEAEITKLEAKLQRILKAQASDWKDNPYWYSERDLRYTEKDLENAQKALADYQAKLEAQMEKDNSRDVEAILTFLENWKNRVFTAYEEALPKYLEARAEYRRLDHEYTDWFNYGRRNATAEEIKVRREENREMERKFKATWSWIQPYINKDELNTEKLHKDLDNEANAKYDFIIERTNKIVGQITDASNLTTGAKGDLNGFIIGTSGKASVKTIGAGGYNIQCYHFRTLIHEMK